MTRNPTPALLLMFALVLSPNPAAGELPHAKPADMGISDDRFTRVNDVLERYIDAGRASGIVTLISRHGHIVHASAIGTMGIEDQRPMQMDALFRIMSMTKAVTAVAALVLYEEGHFQLYDPVSQFLPAYGELQVFEDGELRNAEQPITVHQLFTHTAGLSYGYPEGHPALASIKTPPEPNKSANAIEQANDIAALPLLYEPGTDWQYSYASDVLGALVEAISGQPLGEFFHERIFAPLDMRDTSFVVEQPALERLTTAHAWNAQTNQAEILSAPPFEAPYRYLPHDAGGAGLVSTARDYMRFLEMLRQGGSLGGQRVLGPKTVAFMTADHLPRSLTDANIGANLNPTLGKGGSHALGIGIYLDPIRRGVLSSPGELEWGGIYKTIYWWDPVEDIVVVSMLQMARSPWQLRFRDDLSVAIYQALLKIAAD